MLGQINIAVRARWAQPTTHRAPTFSRRFGPGALADGRPCGSQNRSAGPAHEVPAVRASQTTGPKRIPIFDHSSRAPPPPAFREKRRTSKNGLFGIGYRNR